MLSSRFNLVTAWQNANKFRMKFLWCQIHQPKYIDFTIIIIRIFWHCSHQMTCSFNFNTLRIAWHCSPINNLIIHFHFPLLPNGTDMAQTYYYYPNIDYFLIEGDKLKTDGKNNKGKTSVSCKKVIPLKITPINTEK